LYNLVTITTYPYGVSGVTDNYVHFWSSSLFLSQL